MNSPGDFKSPGECFYPLMFLEEPSIFISGIRIDEPITTITDLLAAAVCYFAFISLTRIAGKQKLHNYLRSFFLSMGLGTTMGGLLGHGFLYLLPPAWELPGWIVSMTAITLLEQASIEHARKLIYPVYFKLFTWLNIIELVILAAITIFTGDFLYTVIHTASGLLLIVTPLNIFTWARTRDSGSRLFLTAVALAAVATPVFIYRWSIHQWFNHFCICHFLIAVSCLVFYLGARRIVLKPGV